MQSRPLSPNVMQSMTNVELTIIETLAADLFPESEYCFPLVSGRNWRSVTAAGFPSELLVPALFGMTAEQGAETFLSHEGLARDCVLSDGAFSVK